jgi:hypothetical protein
MVPKKIQQALPMICLGLCLACVPMSSSLPPRAFSQVQNEINPGSKGSKPTEATGSIIASFDLGQALKPADFQVIESAGFKTAQAAVGFKLAEIQKAIITIQAPGASTPVSAELNQTEIAQGWVFVFRNLPVGNAKVSIKLLGNSDKPLFEQSQDVLVEANLITPVNFVLDLDAPQNCSGTACTGSIQVTVRARTQCLGLPRFPSSGKPGESLLFGLESLQGSIEKFLINFGDGSPVLETASFPVRHAYAAPGRYKVSVTLDGPACKSPFEIGAYVSVGN